MTPMTIEEAQAKLSELIDHLAAGEERVITRNQQPIARRGIAEPPTPKGRQRQGNAYDTR